MTIIGASLSIIPTKNINIIVITIKEKEKYNSAKNISKLEFIICNNIVK